jgi:hypothetical protein
MDNNPTKGLEMDVNYEWEGLLSSIFPVTTFPQL